uniref:Chloride channel protein n=1 Tax=Schistocephalus solidus TaxID=70667 RepID=A0A183SGH7_SCHSO
LVYSLCIEDCKRTAPHIHWAAAPGYSYCYGLSPAAACPRTYFWADDDALPVEAVVALRRQLPLAPSHPVLALTCLPLVAGVFRFRTPPDPTCPDNGTRSTRSRIFVHPKSTWLTFVRLLVSASDVDYIRLPPEGFANLTVMSDTSLQGSFPAGPRMGRGVILLILALIFKFVGLVLVYGVPVPTGVMLPSIMVSSTAFHCPICTLLRPLLAYSKFCKPGRPCIDPGLYAVVGAAACLGGITRATISLVVIMIELIGGLGHIIPIMVAAMFAKWTGDWLYFGSLYDVQIRLNHYPFLGFDKIVSKVGDTKACDIMHPRPGEGHLELLTENTMTVDDVEEMLYSSEHNGFPVVESIESRCLVGFVSRWDLVRALDLDRSPDARRYGPTAIVCFTDRAPPAILTRKRVSTSVLSPEFSDHNNGRGPFLVDVQHIVDLVSQYLSAVSVLYARHFAANHAHTYSDCTADERKTEAVRLQSRLDQQSSLFKKQASKASEAAERRIRASYEVSLLIAKKMHSFTDADFAAVHVICPEQNDAFKAIPLSARTVTLFLLA